MPGELRQLVVGKQHVHLGGVLDDEVGHAGEHTVAEVHTVDQGLPVDDLVKDKVIVRVRQPGQLNDLAKVIGVVVQVTGGQQAAPCRQAHDRPGPMRRRGQRPGRAVEQLGDRRGISELDGDRHAPRIPRNQ